MKKSAKIISIIVAVCVLLALTSCEETGWNETSSPAGAASGMQSAATAPSVSKFDSTVSYDDATAAKITFDGTSVTADDSCTVDGGKVTIKSAGTYVVSGTATDGQIIVNVTKADKVVLVLNNANITCASSAPIYVMSADKVKITLADGTVNTLTDGAVYTNMVAENEPNACVYSKDDITFNGTGTLNVTAHYNNGIGSKNDVRINGGIINVTAKNHGIKGKDSVIITDGTVTVNAQKDGIKSDNELEKGYINISGGKVSIIAGDDALQAFSSITISGGKVNCTAEGKITNCDGSVSVGSGCLTVLNG